jgi:hypothetical protein
MPDPEPIRHLITGEHIILAPVEKLQRFAGSGAPVLVETHPGRWVALRALA